jgi:hypothetical protein
VPSLRYRARIMRLGVWDHVRARIMHARCDLDLRAHEGHTWGHIHVRKGPHRHRGWGAISLGDQPIDPPCLWSRTIRFFFRSIDGPYTECFLFWCPSTNV